jgi:aspartate aminotransferase
MTKLISLADRLSKITLSPMMKAAMEAERMKRAGVDVVDLGAGEPDFPTPEHIADAARWALDSHFTKYTPNIGIIELREAVASRYLEDTGVSFSHDEVIITAGGKQALYHAAMSLFGPGDEVVTHAPGWPTILEQVKLAGATPVVVDMAAHDGFTLNAERLLAAVTPRTRAIVVNSPTNPTGTVMSEASARTLASGAKRRGLWVVIDLCYDRLVYQPGSANLLKIFTEEMRDQFVVCGSTSKAYAMTGWRCGWLVGPKAVVQAANALQSHETSNVNSITQKAAVAALTGPQNCVTDMLREYRVRRDELVGWLAEERRLTTTTPQGAFYLFPSVRSFLSPNGCPTSLEFANRLLTEEHVVVTPGEAFSAPGYVRLSYATSLDRLREGTTRLIRFARSLA